MHAFDPGLMIRTERLLLRPFDTADAPAIHEVIQARHEFLPPGAPGHVSGVSQWLRHGVHELSASGQGIHLAITTEGEIVGGISLFSTRWGAGITEIGYGVHPAHRGNGYATEAVRGLSRHVMAETGLHRAEIRVNLDNAPSLRVADKAGFVKEGVLRDAGMEDDGPHDLVVFGLLRSDLADGPARHVPSLGPARLETARLTLRPFEAADAGDVLAASGDPDIRRWLKWAHDFDRERARDFCLRRAHLDPGTTALCAFVDRETGRLSGAVSLFGADWTDGFAYCGYWTAPWARRRGYAAEAAEAMVQHAFSRGLARVDLWAAVGNTASQRVAERSGFTREGLLRGAGLLPSGERTDMTVFGRLRDDVPTGTEPSGRSLWRGGR
ncbi:GNAT family N-acetyltransferase [Streptosporangium sp. KLBMP 9127]|nr:GNAT family N-acetyltransferase [Streptosporangium sp. KLBMP 9127]